MYGQPQEVATVTAWGCIIQTSHDSERSDARGSGETAPQCPLGLSRSDWGLNINRILISVERAASGHVVNPVLYALKDFGIFLGPFCRDSVDNVGVLGDGGEDGVDELDDVNHVLLNKAA